METETSDNPEVQELSILVAKARRHIALRAGALVLSLFVVFTIGMVMLAKVPAIPLWLPVSVMVAGVMVCIVVYAQFGMTIVYRRARQLGYRVVMNESGRCFALRVTGSKQRTGVTRPKTALLMTEALGLYDRQSSELIPLEDPSLEELAD